MRLLEREAQLAQLTEGYDRALHGDGRLLLLRGEAGAGKTSLLQHFIRALPSATTCLIAGCEPLFTARPLGPIVDLADSLSPALTLALRDPGRSHTLFPDFLAFLRQPPTPKVLVIEDLHWADEGTLDLVRHVGRRLVNVPVLFLASYRDDDLTADHPLRRLLGELPAATTVRVAVPCLSRAGVAVLARDAQRTEQGLFEITGGNPFFVTEALNCRDGIVPPSVYDATANRLLRLSPRARALAELVSISPKWIERSLVSVLVDEADDLVDECVEKGLLRAGPGWVSFRHELARQAAEQSLKPSRSADLHRRMFALLRAQANGDDGLSRLVHHAQLADLRVEILRLAPRAARAASAASAHRQAAEHYTLAIRYASDLEPAERAELLEQAAQEYRLVGNVSATIATTRRALELRTELGDIVRQGMNRRRLAVALRDQGQPVAAEEAIAQSVATLEEIVPSVELVRAYAELSWTRSWSSYEEAVRIGERALALAASFDDARCMVEALHACLSAKMYLRDDREARAELERALGLAIDEVLEDEAARLFTTLQRVGVIYRDHAWALDIARRGLAYCEARDLDSFVFRLLDNRALSLTELGRWDEADLDIERCLHASNIAERLRNSVVFLQARQSARRGFTDVNEYWTRLQHDLKSVPMDYRAPAIAAACAEAAWLRSDHASAQRVVASGIEAVAHNDVRLLAPLLVWAQRCGSAVACDTQSLHAPHALELDGDIAAAADAWARRGCRYERALTLVHGDERQMRDGLRELDALGAKPAAEIARERLRSRGARDVRRGPQPRTIADPLGLTARERQVYEFLLQALPNARIAQRLRRSERTIEHHVASILAKLGVSSRARLAARVETASTPSSE